MFVSFLRVEFQNKFYSGMGVKFCPFAFSLLPSSAEHEGLLWRDYLVILLDGERSQNKPAGLQRFIPEMSWGDFCFFFSAFNNLSCKRIVWWVSQTLYWNRLPYQQFEEHKQHRVCFWEITFFLLQMYQRVILYQDERASLQNILWGSNLTSSTKLRVNQVHSFRFWSFHGICWLKKDEITSNFSSLNV